MIFIQIAAYRDAQLAPTVQNCMEKAKYKDNIVFGIVNQRAPEDPFPSLPRNCRYDMVPHSQSKGACWARNRANKLYEKEEFYLQIDSHTRFEQDWDKNLLDQFEKCGSNKPIFTGYPAMFWLDDDGKDVYGGRHPNITVGTGWNHDQMLILESRHVAITEPRNAIALAGGFIFTTGDFATNVPYDPDLYFVGEEIMLSIQAFTRGYDLLHPADVPLYHFYVRQGATRHWTDNKEWPNYHSHAKTLLHDALQGRKQGYFGDVRTLEQYQQYAGIDFMQFTILDGIKDATLEPAFGLSSDNKESVWQETTIQPMAA